MAGTPIYTLYKKPRISANQLAKYMNTTTAQQRDKIIQDSKFVRSRPVTAYRFAKETIRNFFLKGGGDLAYFDTPLFHLQQIIDSDEEKRDDARRDKKAIEAFIDLYGKKKWKYHFEGRTIDHRFPVEGVAVNVRCDVTLSQGADGQSYSGGLVMFVAGTDQARRNIEVRRRGVTQLILWALEEKSNRTPLPRLCMSMDVLGRELIKASASSSQFRQNARTSCREIATKWNSIEPPKDYDGPDWQ